MKKNLIESFDKFKSSLNEEAYDEPEKEPTAGINAEDYVTKDQVHDISITAEQVWTLLEDGEQLEPSQVKLIQKMHNDIHELKRQIEDREEVKQKEEEDIAAELDNPNL